MSKELRIVFLGTPEFAAASLRKLVESKFNIVAVITAPDKPKGRGKKIGMSAVKECALEFELPVLQPTNLKSTEFLDELATYQADLQIVVAFRMMPEVLWNMPRLGTFNLHASLLPQYRGAAPINWAIINGETETGITTFFLKHEIDTGEILFQETEPIHEDDTVGTLYERLMNKGADLVVKTAHAIQEENYAPKPQSIEGEIKHAPKIFKEDCKINWDQPSNKIKDFVRGLAPYPAAWTLIDDKVLKVFKVEDAPDMEAVSGSFNSDGKSYLRFKTANGTLSLLEIQLEGKRKMNVEEFLRGYKPPVN